MTEIIDSERETRIVNGMVDLARRHTTPAEGEFSLFQLLPYQPEVYPGQALSEYFVPARPADREELMREGAEFCPNIEEVLAEAESNTQLWDAFTQWVNEGYRVNPLTNHRAIPDVALNKVIQALILSKPEYLGDHYFDIASLSISKPVSLFQYGEVTETKPDGEKYTRPRSAVEEILKFSGVELVLPGTRTLKGSAYINEDDRKLINDPIKAHRQQMHQQGGMIIDSAGSASEDWRMVGPDGKTLIIQQTMSKGTAADLIGEKALVLPTAVVFDSNYNAKIWAGTFARVTEAESAHKIMHEIAYQAEILSGEKTRYVDDHTVLERLNRFRTNADKLGERALRRYSEVVARLDRGIRSE